jgi:hypothetical protein
MDELRQQICSTQHSCKRSSSSPSTHGSTTLRYPPATVGLSSIGGIPNAGRRYCWIQRASAVNAPRTRDASHSETSPPVNQGVFVSPAHPPHKSKPSTTMNPGQMISCICICIPAPSGIRHICASSILSSIGIKKQAVSHTTATPPLPPRLLPDCAQALVVETAETIQTWSDERQYLRHRAHWHNRE